MSIFTTAPPSFSKSEIKEIVLEYYGLITKVELLDSDRDQNFYLQNNNGKEYVIKIYNSDERQDIIDLQTDLLIYFEKCHSSFIIVPTVVKSLNGTSIIKIKKDNILYVLRLTKFVIGRQLKDINKNAISNNELGFFIGNLTKSLFSYKNDLVFRKFEWDLQNIDFLLSYKNKLDDRNKEKIVDYFVDQYKKNVVPKKGKFRSGVIHNDCNDHNIIVGIDNKISGLIDFGDIVHSFLVVEPAVCIAYAILGEEDIFSICADIVKGFNCSFKLMPEEINSIIYLVCLRLCISVVMSKYRSKLFPNNKYLLVSNKKAWEVLYYMYNQDLRKWAHKLALYINE